MNADKIFSLGIVNAHLLFLKNLFLRLMFFIRAKTLAAFRLQADGLNSLFG